MRFRIDKLGVVIATLLAYGAFLAPFANFRANRIVPGEPRAILGLRPVRAWHRPRFAAREG